MKKIAIILLAIGLVGCTVSLVLVKNSDNTDVRHGVDGGLDSGLDVDLSKQKDTIE